MRRTTSVTRIVEETKEQEENKKEEEKTQEKKETQKEEEKIKKEDNKEILECTICYEDLLTKENHSIIFSPCGHEICKKCTLKQNFTKCCFCNSRVNSTRKIVSKLKLEENFLCKGCNFVFDRSLKAPHSINNCGHHLCKGCTDEKRAFIKLNLEKNQNYTNCFFEKCKAKLVLEDLEPIIYHKKFMDVVLEKGKDKIKINNDKFEDDFKKNPDFIKDCFTDLQKDLDYQKIQNQKFYASFNVLNTVVNKTNSLDSYLSYQKIYIKNFNIHLKENEYKLKDNKKIKNLLFHIDELKKNFSSNNNFMNLFNNLKRKYETDKKINFGDFMNSFYYLKRITSKNCINSEISKKLLFDLNNILLINFQNKIKIFILSFSKFIKESTTNFYNILNLKENTNFEDLKNKSLKQHDLFKKIDFKEIKRFKNKYSKNLFLDSDNGYINFEKVKNQMKDFEIKIVKKEENIVEMKEEDLDILDLFN